MLPPEKGSVDPASALDVHQSQPRRSCTSTGRRWIAHSGARLDTPSATASPRSPSGRPTSASIIPSDVILNVTFVIGSDRSSLIW